ncbi:hypothetical protein LZ31DRAFT_83747 [Colletotrichum somersetense]|nr:hypothetical protein LZ31DRAFT_83747 [Colletotrichum somersetense]
MRGQVWLYCTSTDTTYPPVVHIHTTYGKYIISKYIWVHSGSPCDLQSRGGGVDSVSVVLQRQVDMGWVSSTWPPLVSVRVPCFVLLLACLLSHFLSHFFSFLLIMSSWSSASQPASMQGRRSNPLPNRGEVSSTGIEVNGRSETARRRHGSRTRTGTESDSPLDRIFNILEENSG